MRALTLPERFTAAPAGGHRTARTASLLVLFPYRSLLQLYIDIETTDRHNQFTEKFITRQYVSGRPGGWVGGWWFMLRQCEGGVWR